MAEISATEYGIKYKKVQIKENVYILIPMELVEGYSVGDVFYSDEVYGISNCKEKVVSEEVVVDCIYKAEDLKNIYEYGDIEFVKEYYLCEEKDYFIYVEVIGDTIKKRKIRIDIFASEKAKETYEKQQNKPALILNEDALSILLSSENIEDIKAELARYRKSLSYFSNISKTDGATKVEVVNGHIARIETEARIIDAPEVNVSKQNTQADITHDTCITVAGLEQFILERVFGHPSEIRKIATKIIMNFRSKPEYGTEPILIAGPTGTGKTETIKAASEYLAVPFVEINTPDLVPQGIRGASLESYLNSLKILCNGDLARAEKGFVYLDEFDKLGKTDLDIKAAVKEILLKFLEGGSFIVDDRMSNYIFNTAMLNKICTGAFQELFETPKKIGFGTTEESEMQFNPKKIYEEEYYGKELVTRIPHIIPYLPLTREEQKRVILESKISKYFQKKRRYEEEFGVELTLEDEFITGLLDQLEANDQSMRDVNNRILDLLTLPEYEILSSPSAYKKLILTRETLDNPSKFTLK